VTNARYPRSHPVANLYPAQQEADTAVAWADITGVPATFPPDAHTHPASEVTAGTFAAGDYVFPSGLVVTGDLTVSGQNLNLGLTKDLAAGSVPYHILYGGHSTTPSQVIIGANGDAAIYLDATNSIWFRDLAGNARFQFNVNGTPYMALSGTQVLTTRRTGWSAPTATLSRAALANGATLTQVTQILAALITDLYSGHGLIGA
jgi:hypothetical protein